LGKKRILGLAGWQIKFDFGFRDRWPDFYDFPSCHQDIHPAIDATGWVDNAGILE
jgi:hypothetical protein